MIHDPSHIEPLKIAKEIILSEHDKDILKSLGAAIFDIAANPVHKQKAGLWTSLNDLKAVRPMLWMYEVPWHEMNIDDELTCKCSDEWAKGLEYEMRKTIYQWRHFPGDMIVNDFIECPLVIHSSDFGIIEDVDVARTDANNDIYSRHFKIQIAEPEDIEKIKIPKITYDTKATEYSYNAMREVFEGIIDVKKVGQKHIWYTPWDYLIRWWGVQEAMMDLVLRPDMVHMAYERMVSAWMTELDQFTEMNLLSIDNNNIRIGSGGYGYVSSLPGEDYDENKVMPHNMWGCSNAQIFSTVSPEMHWEFAIEHDLKWLSRFGLTYYGCCEPLDNKIDILRRIPNLRKISASPWCDTKKIINSIGNDYVISRKPNPAILATERFDPDQARKELVDFMEATEGECNVEIILKDISTVKYDPKRLFEWQEIAMRVCEDYSK